MYEKSNSKSKSTSYAQGSGLYKQLFKFWQNHAVLSCNGKDRCGVKILFCSISAKSPLHPGPQRVVRRLLV